MVVPRPFFELLSALFRFDLSAESLETPLPSLTRVLLQRRRLVIVVDADDRELIGITTVLPP